MKKLPIFVLLGFLVALSGCSTIFDLLGLRPEANINAQPTTPAIGSKVTLDASASSGTSLKYSWTMSAVPSGSTASLSDLSGVQVYFTVDVAGDYKVSLTVTGSTGSDTTSKTITVAAATYTLTPAASTS